MKPSASTGKMRPNVSPSAKSVQKIKTRLTALTQRNLTAIALSDIVGRVNRSLKGWTGYFNYGNSSAALSKVKSHAEERLRTHFRKRHKVKNRGTGWLRYPAQKLYDCYGLYKVPTTAGWRKAHASV